MAGPFLRDIKEIPRRARGHLEQGHGDRRLQGRPGDRDPTAQRVADKSRA